MKNFSGVCQAAGADKPLRAFFIWITNIVTLSATRFQLVTKIDQIWWMIAFWRPLADAGEFEGVRPLNHSTQGAKRAAVSLLFLCLG